MSVAELFGLFYYGLSSPYLDLSPSEFFNWFMGSKTSYSNNIEDLKMAYLVLETTWLDNLTLRLTGS